MFVLRETSSGCLLLAENVNCAFSITDCHMLQHSILFSHGGDFQVPKFLITCGEMKLTLSHHMLLAAEILNI
jgi:hypothetical protein